MNEDNYIKNGCEPVHQTKSLFISVYTVPGSRGISG